MATQRRRTKRTALKVAIVASGETMLAIAEHAHVGYQRLAQIVAGLGAPTDTERKDITKALRARCRRNGYRLDEGSLF